jgi:hypothetical protein
MSTTAENYNFAEVYQELTKYFIVGNFRIDTKSDDAVSYELFISDLIAAKLRINEEEPLIIESFEL